MDKAPILKSKLMVPAIPSGALHCDRIKALNISKPRAVMITAPAGYGKTTAVLLSLKRFRTSTHWYRMEKEDASPSIFFANLIEALFGAEAHALDSYRSLSSIGDILEDYPLLSAVICQDAWAQSSGGADYLVFDDFQYVAGSELICETIRYLISNMPPNIHIIVISRVNTRIRTQKLELEGELVSIDERALLFSKEETDTLFSTLGGSDVSSEVIGAAYESTEGWAAGIMLMIHSIASMGGENEPVLTDDRSIVFRYLLGEALSGIDGDRMREVALISLFSEFTTGDLCAVLSIDRPEETVAWLEENNLYLQKIGEAEPVYRFHSLFRDALQSHLSEIFTTDELARLRVEAGDYFVQTGRFKVALEQYLLAGESQKAVSVAAFHGQAHMDNGDIDAASELVNIIPGPLVHQNATLLMILGASLLNTQTDKSFAYLEESLKLAVARGELVLAINIQGMMISVCAQRSDFRSIKGIVSQVPMLRAMMASKRARKMLLMSLFTKAVVTDNAKMGKALLGVVNRLDTKGDLWEYSNHITKATLYGTVGDFHETERLILQIIEHPIALRNDRWRSLGLYICCNLAVLMCDRELSPKLIDSLAAIGEKYASAYSAGSAAYFSGISKYQRRDFEGAIAALSNAESVFVENQNHVMAASSRVMRTAWQAEREPDKDFSAQADAQLDTLMAFNSYHGIREVAQTLAAAQHFKQGSFDNAEALLLKAYGGAKGMRASQSLCGIAMHLAALYHAKGDLKREDQYLRHFSKSAANNGYLYMREMSYAALVRVCARCVEKKLAPGHMTKLIATYFGSSAAEELLREPSNAAAQPEAFMARFPTETVAHVRQVKIKLLGDFSLTVDGVEIDPALFKTRKISGILKYILANPRKTVSRETLATAFWPDSDSKAAFTSLRVALFELRKALASVGMAFDTADALIAEGKNGFYVCSPENISSDAEGFSEAYERTKEKGIPAHEVQPLLQRMVELYDDDFLADDIYSEWADVSRERYRSIYIEASHKLAEQYFKGGDSVRAEALLAKHMTIDPYDEKACRALISLYTQSGRGEQASALKRQFTKRFKSGMGIEPELG